VAVNTGRLAPPHRFSGTSFRTLCPALALVLLASGAPGSLQERVRSQAPADFPAWVAALSEAGGSFDTDNLISNERSYLQVLPAISHKGLTGGAYIGVGPDQNFSYIAALEPEIAFIIDIRRDNLLLHLLFKALFGLSEGRAEYLALLLGRTAPPASERPKDLPISRIIAHVDRPALSPSSIESIRKKVDLAIARAGVPLTPEDLATIDRFHRRFIDAGLDLRFNSTGRPPQSGYPTYRELLLETDADGRQGSYLASEKAFAFVKALQARDLVIPVVGDLSGPSALSSIARLLSSRRQHLSALYASNVEFYLFRQGRYPEFVANLQRMPRSQGTVVIRSVFGRFTSHARPGDVSTSELHAAGDLIRDHNAGLFRSYTQLVGGR